jgi:Na+/proline symporter
MWVLLEIGTEELVIELVIAVCLIGAAVAPFGLRAMRHPRGEDSVTSGRADATPFSLLTLVGSGVAAVVAVALLATIVARWAA